MGTPLKNPPVYFTVCQVRFNAILKLGEFLPSIQENLRRAGYPAYNVQNSFVLQMVAQPKKSEPPVQPVPMPHESFFFGNLDKTHVFALDSQSLTLQSTNYGCFEDFLEEFLKGLRIVHEAIQLAFTERVGLRYLDRVMPISGEDLSLYLVPEVHGVNRHLGGQPMYSYSEAMNQIGDVRLRARVVIQSGELAFPPDLQPNDMAVDKRFVEYVGPSAILDNDGFVEARNSFTLETVAKQLTEIHAVVDDAFKATATKHAFTAWGQK